MRRALWVGCLATACLVLGCAHQEVTGPPLVTFPPIHDVVVYTWPRYVQVGDTLRVEAGGFNTSGWEFTEPIHTVAWATGTPDRIRIESAPWIAAFQPAVYARGLAPGTATISATLNGVTGSDSVIVLPLLRGIELTRQTATIHVGQTLDITARIVAEDGSILVGPYIIWSSSDYNVAAFGPGTTVLALHPGAALITATLARAVATLTVTVLP